MTFETLIEAFLDVYRKGSRPRYVHPHAAPHAAHLLRPHPLYGCPPDCDDPEGPPDCDDPEGDEP
jgi:hypothetical protein